MKKSNDSARAQQYSDVLITPRGGVSDCKLYGDENNNYSHRQREATRMANRRPNYNCRITIMAEGETKVKQSAGDDNDCLTGSPLGGRTEHLHLCKQSNGVVVQSRIIGARRTGCDLNRRSSSSRNQFQDCNQCIYIKMISIAEVIISIAVRICGISKS
jgi:hypothetical protein